MDDPNKLWGTMALVSRMMHVREFAENVTHRVVLRRRLPKPFAELYLYVSSEGGLRYLRPSLVGVDPVVLETVARYVRPGARVWDVGSNLGLFAIPAASMAGPAGSVVALEADPWLTRVLGKSIRANHAIAPISLVCAAASRQPGVAQFNIARRSRATSFIEGYGSTQTGGVRCRLTVPTLALDTLARQFAPPDVLKIDVEGAEVEVLAGASAVLEHRPTIFLEVASASCIAIHDILRPLGYRYFDAQNGFVEVAMPAYQTVALV